MGLGMAATSVFVSVTLSVGLWSSTTDAANSGGRCKNTGAVVEIKEVTYQCTKSDKSLKWVVIQRQSEIPNITVTEPAATTTTVFANQTSTWISDMIAMVNQERAVAGLKSVIECFALDQSAVSHSQDMSTRDFFDHTNPYSKTHADRIRSTGYMSNSKRRWTGENIAKGFVDVASVMVAWMESPGHRANILNPIFTHLGIGFVSTGPDSIYDGFIWTQDFGSGGTC